MLVVENLNYASKATIVFQRLSVIVTDLLFIYAVKEFISTVPVKKTADNSRAEITSQPKFIITILMVGNFGLLIVDHIHFQYNGFLFGFMLLSIARLVQGRNLEGALWFAVLLNFKHIYLYIAPAYFIYLLRCYCFTDSYKDRSVVWSSLKLQRLVSLGLIVIGVTAVSFGPFIMMGQIEQVLSRLFPFKRGLCHAYWAPNFWVFYNIADKALTTVMSRFGVVSGDAIQKASMTGGLVQESSHSVLPSVSPIITLVATVLSILPAMYNLWRYPRNAKSFIRCLTLCAYGSFMFGWHVHEKAILLIVLPMCLLAIDNKRDAQTFLLLSTVGHYSLFPLLYKQAETPIKVCLMLMYCLLAFTCLGKLHRTTEPKKKSKQKADAVTAVTLLPMMESLYLLGLIPFFVVCDMILPFLSLTRRLQFLPLMLTSSYCALGVTWSWLRFYWDTLSGSSNIHKKMS
ncbi:dolichyl pyrophosphate Glc1Man9GlcNAc2 alpha-1,3-glucosyltransferase-like isoform X2 [Ptychodera flava]